MKRLPAIIISVLFLASAMAGCSSSKDTADNAALNTFDYSGVTNSASTEMAYDDDISYEKSGIDELSSTSLPADSGDVVDTADLEATERKIIRNAELDVETTEFDSACASVESLVSEYGGYISNVTSSTYNTIYSLHKADYTLRIPADKLDEFLAEKESFGVTTYSYIWQNDITDSYYDAQTHLKTLETQKDRLLALMEQAGALEDIIDLENALSDTIYQIEVLEGTLRRYDNQIDYSTVSVNITEVLEETNIEEAPKTLGERISQRFNKSIQSLGDFGKNLIVFVAGNIITILIVAALATAVVILVIRANSNRELRRAKRRERAEEELARWQANKEDKPDEENKKDQ